MGGTGKLLYEMPQGSIGKVPTPPNGSILTGGNQIEWKRLDATVIPYTSNASGAIANVSVALDTLLATTARFQAILNTLERENARIDGQQSDLLNSLTSNVAALNSYVTEAVNRMSRTSHAPASVSIVSNPALVIDRDRQVVTLDLTAKGSFDDSKSRLGVTSVQLALESMAARQQELSFSVIALQDNVKALQKAVSNLQGD